MTGNVNKKSNAALRGNGPGRTAQRSRTRKAIAPCLLTSIVTVLLGDEPHRAVMAWCVGVLIAAVALRERLRAR